MKKLTVLLTIALLTAINVTAQKYYFRAGLGYALAHGGAAQAPVYFYSPGILLPVNGTNNVVATSTNYSESFDLSRQSYTSGIQGVLAVGAMFTQHLGVELAANLGVSNKTMKTSLNTSYPGEKTVLNVSQKANSPMMLTPSIVLETGGKINVYSRGGIVIPLKTGITQEGNYIEERFNEATNTFVTTTTIGWEEDYSMRLSPGFSGALGVKIKPGKKLSVWAEAGILSMSLFYKSSELTRFERKDQTGQYSLGNIPASQRTTQYEFSGTYSNTGTTAATTQAPFSNFNITAGVAFDL